MQPGTSLRLSLPREPQAAAVARRGVAGVCRMLSRETFEVTLLLTSELVTNALKHGHGDIALVVRTAGSRLRVEVYDQAPGMPRVSETSPLANLGRGLMLVERLSTAWGVDPVNEWGEKRVWFELSVPDR